MTWVKWALLVWLAVSFIGTACRLNKPSKVVTPIYVGATLVEVVAIGALIVTL